ncbi:ScbA/BarX family gamma-butyrolactone biosynthesis protein [Streptomyces sp. CoH27]|uniref:ScbA/BarX family gamma-butyrolactone biosynthesis protein n=1 Tax=Streptomyces sp. CoH27 TaxID=2875763 RepID=UPI001CD6CCB5|nr:ScbA/BarX family gamma-butyrolactone biosynthesis protein [Streptomyces sp. CoH27]
MDFDRSVPCESVHKAAAAEVLLTDAARLGDERFAVAAVWRRDHFLAHHEGPSADPVLLAETARQAAIHLSHRFFDVAYGMPFVLSEISVDLSETLPPVDAGHLAVGLDVHCRPPAEGTRRLQLELRADVLARHRRVGSVGVCWEPMQPRRYALVRRRGAQEPGAESSGAERPRVPLRPADVGQLVERDVLLAADPLDPPGANRWWLRLDRAHPVLFDHESDHVPGMALVEAFRQAGRVAAADRRPGASGATLLSVTFTAFGELDLPVSLTAEPADRGTGVFTLRALQGERELAHATVSHPLAHPCGKQLETAC